VQRKYAHIDAFGDRDGRCQLNHGIRARALIFKQVNEYLPYLRILRRGGVLRDPLTDDPRNPPLQNRVAGGGSLLANLIRRASVYELWIGFLGLREENSLKPVIELYVSL
jgi:hypothetical protein